MERREIRKKKIGNQTKNKKKKKKLVGRKDVNDIWRVKKDVLDKRPDPLYKALTILFCPPHPRY